MSAKEKGDRPHKRTGDLAPAPSQWRRLGNVPAGRIQPGPFAHPTDENCDLEHWQDPDEFHSPEL